MFLQTLHVQTSKTFLVDFPFNRIHIVSNLPWCRFFEVPTRKRYNTCLENSPQQIFQRFLELAEQWRDTCSEILCQQQNSRERISKVIQKSIIFYGLGSITLELDIFDMKAFPSQYCFKGSILQYHNFERSVILHFTCKYMIALLLNEKEVHNQNKQRYSDESGGLALS